MSAPLRRSSRTKTPALNRAGTVNVYEIPKKHTREEKQLEKKLDERRSRAGRGLKRANTFFEYAGHPETRETKDNPFGHLVGSIIDVWWPKKKTWLTGEIEEFDAFNGLHLVFYPSSKQLVFHNLSKTKYRKAGSQEAEVPPTKTESSKPASHTSKKPKGKGKKTVHDDENEDEHDHVIPTVVKPVRGASITGAGAGAAPPKGFVQSTEGNTAVVDPESGLTGKGEVYVDGETVYEANLGQVNRATNTDKYYILQVVESHDKTKYWTVNHWGRTGAKGQTKVEGPFDDKQEAIDVFQKKFGEKSGINFKDRETAAPVDGKYQYKIKKYITGGKGSKIMWQYFVDDFVDGKATGWYNYMDLAAETVEGVYLEWRFNSWLDVRCVQSGYFEYRVDFNDMTQRNLKTNKCRKIQRVMIKEDDK